MAPRTPDHLIQRARKMLASGMQSVAVAKEVGLCPSRVYKIRSAMANPPPSRTTKTKTYVRCGECGGKVLMPCMACGMRNRREIERKADNKGRIGNGSPR